MTLIKMSAFWNQTETFFYHLFFSLSMLWIFDFHPLTPTFSWTVDPSLLTESCRAQAPIWLFSLVMPVLLFSLRPIYSHSILGHLSLCPIYRIALDTFTKMLKREFTLLLFGLFLQPLISCLFPFLVIIFLCLQNEIPSSPPSHFAVLRYFS